jgi:RND family efflux transporter MFP subunit
LRRSLDVGEAALYDRSVRHRASHCRPVRGAARVSPGSVLLRAAVIALSGLHGLGCTSESKSDDKGAKGPPPATVRVGEVRSGALVTEWSVLGEVRSQAEAELAAGADGEVQAVHVREGDQVDEGDLLVAVDPSLARARLRAARADRRRVQRELAQAKRDAERFESAGNEAVAAAEIERAASEVERLKAQEEQLAATIEEAQAELRRHRVVAPFPGQIKARSVDPGDWVDPGDPLVTLFTDRDTEIMVAAPLELVDYVHRGDRATLRRGERSVPARVEGTVNALDRTTRTVTLRLVAEDAASWLLPGSTVDAVFQVKRTDPSGVIVPRDALVMGAVGTRVIVPEDGKARPLEIEVVATSAEEALVRGDGLRAGMQVVTRGNERLRPDQPLKVGGSPELDGKAKDAQASDAAEQPTGGS